MRHQSFVFRVQVDEVRAAMSRNISTKVFRLSTRLYLRLIDICFCSCRRATTRHAKRLGKSALETPTKSINEERNEQTFRDTQRNIQLARYVTRCAAAR
jgi:hypothetical protein